MSPEELDKAIEALLEERPNEDKPKRRRRNKVKDIMRKARSNQKFISDKIIEDLIGDKLTHHIEYVYIDYIADEEYIGTTVGLGNSHKRIAEYLGKPTNKLRLVPEYDWVRAGEELVNERTGEVHIYEKVFRVEAYFYDKDFQRVTTLGIFRNVFVKELDTYFKRGWYHYTEKTKEFIEEVFNKAPNQEYVREVDKYPYIRDLDKLFTHDTKGKYKLYAKAARERDKSKWWQETYRVEKCKNDGTKQRLINYLNEVGRGVVDNIDYHINGSIENGDDYYGQLDELVLDYEYAYYDVVYEYVW